MLAKLREAEFIRCRRLYR